MQGSQVLWGGGGGGGGGGAVAPPALMLGTALLPLLMLHPTCYQSAKERGKLTSEVDTLSNAHSLWYSVFAKLMNIPVY